ARGHDFVIVTWADQGCPDRGHFHGIPIYRFPFFSRGPNEFDLTIEHLHAIAKLKREYAPDVVHVNCYGSSAWYHIATAKAHPSPTLVTLHALPDRGFMSGRLAKRLLDSADYITCCSSAVLEATSSVFPEIKSRSRVVHNALEVPSLNPEPLSFERPRL